MARFRWSHAVVVASMCLAVLAVAPEMRADDPVAAVRRAADTYAVATRGVVAFDVTTRSAVRGGPYRRDDLESAAYVVTDGKPSRKRVLKLVEGRHVADAAELQRASAKPDGPLSRFGMRLPFANGSVDAYAYEPARAEDGLTSIAFRANVRDESHGDGSIAIDEQHRPVRVVFRPAKLPEHASEATVTVEFGTTATGRWDVTRIARAFSGRVGIVGGRVDSVSTYDAYRAFPTADLANAAIDRE